LGGEGRFALCARGGGGWGAYLERAAVGALLEPRGELGRKVGSPRGCWHASVRVQQNRIRVKMRLLTILTLVLASHPQHRNYHFAFRDAQWPGAAVRLTRRGGQVSSPRYRRASSSRCSGHRYKESARKLCVRETRAGGTEEKNKSLENKIMNWSKAREGAGGGGGKQLLPAMNSR
jgi:hypothetical protein